MPFLLQLSLSVSGKISRGFSPSMKYPDALAAADEPLAVADEPQRVSARVRIESCRGTLLLLYLVS